MKIAYNGANFYGFQKQKDRQTISGFLENVFKSVGIFSSFVGAGRTDRGVHASVQVISLEIPRFHQDLFKLKEILNTKLYPWVKIKQIWQVEDEFNARFSAKKRGYCYLLAQENSPFLSAFSHYYCVQNPQKIQESLECFKGRHDFRAFMKNDSGIKSSVREIYQARLLKRGKFYILSFWGNGFLRSQVRLMVGFLLEIDKGNLSKEDLIKQLKGERIFSIPAPFNGLFLSRVDY